MSTAALLDRLAPVDERHNGSGPERARSRRWLLDNGLPDRRAEAWRYTPIDAVLAVLADATPATGTGTPVDASGRGVDRDLIDERAGSHGGPRIVFANGRYLEGLSDLDALPAGVLISAGPPHQNPTGGSGPATEPADGFDALNRAAVADITTIEIAPGTVVDAPIHIVHLRTPEADGSPAAAHPRTAVHLRAGSTAQVIESYIGLDPTSFTNAATALTVDAGATLLHDRVVDAHPDAIHLGRTELRQATGSGVRTNSLILDGRIVRSAIDVVLAEPDSTVELTGLHLPMGHQRHDHALTIDHAAANCSSDQRFKGIVAEHGRGSFGGHVIVRPGADGTDAKQSNPNLVLDPTAQADTRPWLEILADDVRCTHGATVGRLDAEAMFYLRSRGIGADEARNMLIGAFAGEIVDGIEPESLRSLVSEALRRHSIEESR